MRQSRSVEATPPALEGVSWERRGPLRRLRQTQPALSAA
jgi:hypothetical protein